MYVTRSLHSLDVSENGLTLIPPPHAWKSLGIRDIKYTSNKLTKLDLSEAKRFWSRLESFYIGHNKIKEVGTSCGVVPSSHNARLEWFR
jgi:Leucine-rich repeat (LRR) protein